MSQGKGHRAVGDNNCQQIQGKHGCSKRDKTQHQLQLQPHQPGWDSSDPTHPVHSPRHQPTARAAFCWVIFSTDQSTEAQETAEVFFLNKKPPKNHCIPMATDWTHGAGLWIQMGRIAGSWQSLGWILGTCRRQEGGRLCKLHVIFVGVRGRQHS